MAAVYAAVVNGNTGTTASTVDYTKTGFGTPKAAIVLCARGETYDTAIANGAFSLGFWDSTTQVCYSCFAEGSGSFTDTTDFGYNNKIMAIDNIDSSLQFSATVANITDGIRITYSANRTAAYKVTVILFNGADLQAKVGALALGTGTSPIEVSCGFQPDLIFATAAASVDGTHRSLYMYPSFGCAKDAGGGTTTHRCSMMFQDVATTASSSVVVRTDCLVDKSTSVGRTWYLTASGWDSNGLDVTPNASTASSYMMYLALDVGSASTWLGTVNPPTTASGAWDSPDTGFTPQLVILGQTLCPSLGSIHTASPMADTFGICAFDGTTEGSIAITEDDEHSDAAAKSYASERLAYLYDGTYTAPTLYYDIGNAVMDSTGWTVSDAEVATADATTRYWWGFALQQGDQGVTVTTTPASLVSASTGPTVILGSVIVATTAASAVAASTGPTVILGSVTVATTPASIILASVDPAVILGSVAVTTTAVSAVMAGVDPTVQITGGDVTVSTTPASLVTAGADPTVVLGSIAVTTTAASVLLTGVDPTVSVGGVSVSTVPASLVVATVDPVVTLGSVSVATSPASCVTATVAPSVVLGSITVSTGVASMVMMSAGPGIVLGSVSVSCVPASIVVLAPLAGVIGGSSLRPQLDDRFTVIPSQWESAVVGNDWQSVVVPKVYRDTFHGDQ